MNRATSGIAWVAELRGPATQAEETRWIADLDENLYVFEAGACGRRRAVAEIGHDTGCVSSENCQLVSAALQQARIFATAIHAPSDLQLGRSAFLVDVDIDSNGVANTGRLLDVCVQSNLELLELTPIASVKGG